MSVIITLLWIAGVSAAVDCLRRPAWQWQIADRVRGFWVPLLILLGPLTIWFYLTICLPKLVQAARGGAGDATFMKR